METELFHADRQTDRHDEADSRFSHFCEHSYKWTNIRVNETCENKCQQLNTYRLYQFHTSARNPSVLLIIGYTKSVREFVIDTACKRASCAHILPTVT